MRTDLTRFHLCAHPMCVKGSIRKGWVTCPMHLRFLDPPNVIVGLRAKGRAKKGCSGFVVHT